MIIVQAKNGIICHWRFIFIEGENDDKKFWVAVAVGVVVAVAVGAVVVVTVVVAVVVAVAVVVYMVTPCQMTRFSFMKGLTNGSCSNTNAYRRN